MALWIYASLSVLFFKISTSSLGLLEFCRQWMTISVILPSWMSSPLYPFVFLNSSPSRLSRSSWIWKATPIFSTNWMSTCVCSSVAPRLAQTILEERRASTPVLCAVIWRYCCSLGNSPSRRSMLCQRMSQPCPMWSCTISSRQIWLSLARVGGGYLPLRWRKSMGAQYMRFPALMATSVPNSRCTQGLFRLTVLESSMSSTRSVPLCTISHRAAMSMISARFRPSSSAMSMQRTGRHRLPPRSSKSQMGWLKVLVRLLMWLLPWLNRWLELIPIKFSSLNSRGIMASMILDSASYCEQFLRTVSMLGEKLQCGLQGRVLRREVILRCIGIQQ